MATTIVQGSHSFIRKVNLRRDLLAVADLIEICFANTIDDDGREYLRQMRWAARDFNYLAWLQGAAERLAAPLYGFVWEENGRIVGNLSLILISRGGRLYYLIANVAVHPDYRRRGIGQQLTQTAIEHLRQRGVKTAWLQVRDDNLAAQHLYLSLGFTERARRTAWTASGPPTGIRRLPEGVLLQRRKMQDWDQQAAWLREIYPAQIAWNLPLNLGRFDPDPLRRFLRWLQGESQEHWAAIYGGRPIGFVSWEPLRGASDPLWLATSTRNEEQAILALLPYMRSILTKRGRQLSVNYPAGRGMDAFQRAGFTTSQTLIWMSVDL